MESVLDQPELQKPLRETEDSMLSPPSLPPITSISCPLLDRLPRELQDMIVCLAFTTDNQQQDGRVALSKASPPSESLLLTCKQVFVWSRDLYKAAYRRYWSLTHFAVELVTIKGSICRACAREIEASLKSIRREDFGHINHLTITAYNSHDPDHHTHKGKEPVSETALVDRCGGWQITTEYERLSGSTNGECYEMLARDQVERSFVSKELLIAALDQGNVVGVCVKCQVAELTIVQRWHRRDSSRCAQF